MGYLLSILPIADFVLLWGLFYRRGADGRAAFLLAALTWGAAIAAITEILSLFHGLTLPGLLLAWIGVGIGVTAGLRRTAAAPFPRFTRLGRLEWALIAGIAAVILVVGITAILSPPNNWDSMTYHLSRVVHWMQNASVAHYPTNIQRQLYQPPWAEYALTHLQILSGGDTLATLVQWFAFLGSAIGVSLIARTLGASRRGQILAAGVAVTVPMAVLQGSSTQNDLVCAFWIVCAVYFVLRAAEGDTSAQTVVAVGAAAGLALLTKATAYLYLLPWGVWFALVLLRRGQALRRWTLTAGAVIVLLNGGYLARNQATYHALTGPDENIYINQVMSPAYWVSNVVRNVALHVSVAQNLSDRFRVAVRLNDTIDRIHAWLGVSKDDPRTTIWYPDVSFSVWSISYDEDQTSAPAHLLVGIVAIGLFALRLPRLRQAGRLPALYLGAALAGFLIFCLVLKVQPWNSRLHLPGFILLAAFVGWTLEKTLPAALGSAVIAGLLILALAPLLNNSTRKLAGNQTIFNTDRWTLTFAKRPELRPVYEQAFTAATQSGCTRVGLYFGGDTWEYPLWVFADAHGTRVDFEHVGTWRPANDFQPCAIIRDTTRDAAPEIQLGGATFVPIWTVAPLDVLVAGSH